MTDVFGTYGPKCASEDTIREMFACGMTGMRVNLSHASLTGHAEITGKIHAAARRAGVKSKILIDLQGPELRIGNLPGEMELVPGERILLGENGIEIPDFLLDEIRPGQEILMDDGKILLEALERRGNGIGARILRGGVLKSRKSILVQGIRAMGPALTAADIENIRVAPSLGITGVMLPFVRGRDDLLKLKAALAEAGGDGIRVYAKIENADGVRKLEELLPAADEIVIARGDLGNSLPLWKLPGLQKKIAAQCVRAGKPFMVVTQMLASMEKSAVPTRAEVSDIYNAVMDGASSVMVTGETAAGDYPVEVIRYLRNTAREAWLDRLAETQGKGRREDG